MGADAAAGVAGDRADQGALPCPALPGTLTGMFAAHARRDQNTPAKVANALVECDELQAQNLEVTLDEVLGTSAACLAAASGKVVVVSCIDCCSLFQQTGCSLYVVPSNSINQLSVQVSHTSR